MEYYNSSFSLLSKTEYATTESPRGTESKFSNIIPPQFQQALTMLKYLIHQVAHNYFISTLMIGDILT